MSADRTTCLACGEPLGIGRFCMNCGHPEEAPVKDESPTSTVERPILSPAPPPASSPAQPPRAAVAPPPVYEAPRPPRYPLWADEALSPPSGPPVLAPPPPAHRPRVGWVAGWVAAAIVLVALTGAGGVLLLGGDDAPTSPGTASPPGTSTPAEPAGPAEPAEPGSSGSAAEPVDLARTAEATPPDTAAPSRDVNGNAVRYEAFNMLDGQSDTAWRMPGDGSGQEVVLRLDSPTAISEVGLINGYAKVEAGYDGYRANRRITAVEWVFGDGTVVAQDLTDDLEVQRVAVDDVVTDEVTLRIVSVSGPTEGPTGRDYTAISEIALVGSPA